MALSSYLVVFILLFWVCMVQVIMARPLINNEEGPKATLKGMFLERSQKDEIASIMEDPRDNINFNVEKVEVNRSGPSPGEGHGGHGPIPSPSTP